MTFMLLAPILTAWRMGREERINALSCAVYEGVTILPSSVCPNVSRAPSSSILAAFLKSAICRSPRDIIRSLGAESKKSFIFCTSLCVSCAPFLIVKVSSPTKVMFSPDSLGSTLVFVTSAMTLPSLSSIILSP